MWATGWLCLCSYEEGERLIGVSAKLPNNGRCLPLLFKFEATCWIPSCYGSVI